MTSKHPASTTYQNHTAVHPSLTADQISMLVDTFYEKVHTNELLGPIFENQTQTAWPDHLAKMKAFWRSVLLKTGEYKGKPVPVHQRLEGVSTPHFEEWLALFTQTSREILTPEAADRVEEAAKRIATSLWLSRTSDPFASPPTWPDTSNQTNSPRLP